MAPPLKPAPITQPARKPAPPVAQSDQARQASAAPSNPAWSQFALGQGAGIPALFSEGLAQYSALKTRAPQHWKLLDDAAAVFGSAQDQQVLETWVGLIYLLDPRPPHVAADLRTRLWPLVTDAMPSADAIAAEIGAEIAQRWLAANPELAQAQVHIRLRGAPGTEPAPEASSGNMLVLWLNPWLEFDIDGEALSSSDGNISLLDLDLLASNTLEAVVQHVGTDAQVIAEAGDLLLGTLVLLDQETDWWAKARADWDSVAGQEVQAHYGLFSIVMTEAPDTRLRMPLSFLLPSFLAAHSEYEPELGEAARRLGSLTQWVHEDFRNYLDYFDSASQDPDLATFREGTDQVWERAGEMWDESTAEGVLGYTVAGLTSALYHIGNTVTGGYSDTRHAGVKAFQHGAMSMDQLDGLTEAAAWRGLAVGVVTTALTLATMGLAGPVLGTASSLGQKMVFFGAANAGTVLGGDLTGTAISAAHDFDDPIQQGIWKQGVKSPGQMLQNTLLGGAIGAGGVVAGLLVSKLATVARRALQGPASTALASMGGEISGSAGTAALPKALPALEAPGWQIEEVGEGIFRCTHPQVQGEVMIAGGRLRYQVPAGSGVMVVADVALDTAAQATRALPSGALGSAKALPTAAKALPPGSPAPAAPPGSVWVNRGSGVYHPPGSRWFGRTVSGEYMTLAQARASGYRAAGMRAPSGTYEVSRPPLGESRVQIKAWIQARQARSGFEKQMMSATEYGLQRLAGMQRGHTVGAGLGAEAEAAIRLETAFVNQQLKRLGIERAIRERFATLAPGDALHLTTATQTHSGTLRLKMVEYKLELVKADSTRSLVFVADIEQALSGRATHSVEFVGEFAQRVMSVQ